MSAQGDIGSLFGLEGKTAVVTGAATGIGREIAQMFVRAGAYVIGADINETELAITVAGANAAAGGERATGKRLDQGDPTSIAALFDEVGALGRPLDVLVNCAAIYPFKPFEEVDAEFLNRNLGINLRGVFLCVQQAVKLMKQRGGAIVNIASVNAMKACIFDNVHYGVAKAGVNNLTISVALEYGGSGIRVNSVMPGSVLTQTALKSIENFKVRGPFTQEGRIPLGRAGTPADIAAACLFLASDASSYITGQVLAVDGGFLVS